MAALSPPPPCSPWDRGDLMRRLASFKAMTWFAKPKAINPVNCARRGWTNIEPDVITCEACGARLLFSTPSSWTSQQVEKAAAVFSLKLNTGHKLLCPWTDNICDESLALFPPTRPPVLVENYHQCFSLLLRLSALPRISCSSLESMKKRSPQLEQFLSEPFSSSVVLKGGFVLTEDSTSKDIDDAFQDANTYYQGVKKLLCASNQLMIELQHSNNIWSVWLINFGMKSRSVLRLVSGDMPKHVLHLLPHLHGGNNGNLRPSNHSEEVVPVLPLLILSHGGMKINTRCPKKRNYVSSFVSTSGVCSVLLQKCDEDFSEMLPAGFAQLTPWKGLESRTTPFQEGENDTNILMAIVKNPVVVDNGQIYEGLIIGPRAKHRDKVWFKSSFNTLWRHARGLGRSYKFKGNNLYCCCKFQHRTETARHITSYFWRS